MSICDNTYIVIDEVIVPLNRGKAIRAFKDHNLGTRSLNIEKSLISVFENLLMERVSL